MILVMAVVIMILVMYDGSFSVGDDYDINMIVVIATEYNISECTTFDVSMIILMIIIMVMILQ